MSDRIKKFLCIGAALLSLTVFNGCGKDNEKTSPPARPVPQHTLLYSAGAGGSIAGVSRQVVDDGATGSPVRAVPDDGYHFENWSDGVTTSTRTDTNVTVDLTVTAVFAVNRYTLSYSAEEGGTLEGSRKQTVKHGEDGSPVTAVADEHYHFAGWSDGITSPERTDRNVTADLELQASFAIDQYTLIYTASENGSIKGASSQTVNYGGDGSPVSAVPKEGYHFVHWSDGVTTASRTDRKVTGALEVNAVFTINRYTLTYTAAEHGSIAGVSPQVVDYGRDGSPVTAVPAEHYHFAGWSDGVSIAGRTDRKVTGDLAVKANFAIDQYTLTYLANENGSIKGAMSQKVDYAGNGNLVTAVPDEGYHFVSWSDGLITASRTDRKVTSDFTVTAGFAVNQYTLTYTAGENGSIEGVSPQTVNYGDTGGAVTAVADKGYHFVNWSDGVSTATRTDSKVAGDLTARAVFAINTYSVGGRVSGLVGGTRLVLQNNAGDDLAITDNGDFRFAAELLDAHAFNVSVLTQPTSPNQTCTVTNGSGTISGEDVQDIMVSCVLNTYRIGGTLSGLPEGDQVTLRNNVNDDDLVITVNGAFSFAKAMDDGKKYEVKVASLPKRANWTCDVENASGTLQGKDVTDVIVSCYPKVVLQAVAGIRKAKLAWNSEDFTTEVTFNLCGAQEAIPAGGFGSCRNLKGGFLQAKVKAPLVVARLTNDIPYWFQVEAHYKTGRQTLSEAVTVTPFGGLNDTGIDWCADETINHYTAGTRGEKTESCGALAKKFPGQDALHGRDAEARGRKLAKTGTGFAGFDFTKVCMSGETAGEGNCPPNPSPGNGTDNWACTHDNVTGLTWEVKTGSGLHSQSNSYTWYNPESTTNGGKAGQQNGGGCKESDCDTEAFVQAVNASMLCGADDWRLPTRKELLSIVDNSRFSPATEPHFFPDTTAENYWSSSPYAEKENFAWEVNFKYGESNTNKKNESNRVRLVRGRTVTFGLHNPGEAKSEKQAEEATVPRTEEQQNNNETQK